jgi:isovaleryl-CoA dehydrogenase
MVKVTKLGHKGLPFGELIFQDCRVPAENLVGEENALVRVVVSGLHRERIIWSAEAVGIAQGAYDIARKYSSEREQFGRKLFGKSNSIRSAVIAWLLSK